MTNEKLRKKIREVFKSQLAFAHHLHEQDSLVSKVVNGWKKLPPERQDKQAKALRTKTKDLFDQNDTDRLDKT